MRFTTLVAPLPALASAAVLERADGCNANNCARAVTGTRDKEPDVTARRSQCSSFQIITVTPDVFTSTITISDTQYETATEHVTETGHTTKTITVSTAIWHKRAITVSPSAVPAYATSCPDASAYASACSCWGVTLTTTTAPTPTAYVTVTVSPTITATATETDSVTETATETTTLPPTATGDLQCRDKTPFGCRSTYPSCPPGVGLQYCLCGFNVEGAKQCMTFDAATNGCLQHPICTSSSQCAAGRVCLSTSSTCCKSTGDPANFRCFPAAYGGCANPQARVRRELLAGKRSVEVEPGLLDEPLMLVPGYE